MVDSSLRIAQNYILNSIFKQELSNGDTSCSCPINDDLALLHILLHDLYRVYQARQSHDCCTVLIVVENWQFFHSIQSFLNLKAFRSLNILKIYRIEVTQQLLNGLYLEFGSLSMMNTDWNHVNIAKQLEEQGFAFHNRQSSLRSDVAQAEYSSSIGDDGKESVCFRVRLFLFGYLPQILLSE